MDKSGLHVPQLLIKMKKLFPRVTIDFEFWTWIYTIVTYYADYIKSCKVTFHASNFPLVVPCHLLASRMYFTT